MSEPVMNEPTTVRDILRVGLLSDRRGWRLSASSIGFMTHQACEAAVPVLIGLVIDRAIATGDGSALLRWLLILGAVFVVLSVSYQAANQGMVRTYSHGEHDLRQLTAARVLHPRGLASRRRTGDVLTVTTSDTYRVAGVAWSIADRRYRAASAASRRGAVASGRSLLTYQSVSTAVSILYLAILTGAAGVMASNGTITIGQLITVVGLAQFLQGSLQHIGTFGANWAHKRASAKRLHALVVDEYALPDGVTVPAERTRTLLVWVPRTGPELRVEEGRMTGVRVTSSQQARDLSARLSYRTPIPRGELTARGVDAVDLGPDVYASLVLAPPHDAMVFSGSLGDNIGGSGPIDDDLVAACALDDVVGLIGLDAPVGEAGRRLSGGQRQRLTLARALHSDADVVVLDEPTTALDPVTEQHVANGLRRSGRTVVVITSSRALLDACDHVVDAAVVEVVR
jgi:ABC-type multidrug transport system fused ATPase/permease subunit